MNPNELRIGNLVQNHDGTLLRVDDLREDYISTYVIDRSKYPLPEGWRLEPIPLTEKRLLELGFHDNDISVNGQQISVAFEAGEALMWGQDGCTSGHAFHAPCRFVHQLQNLYFALTGEELETNTKILNK